MHTGRTSSSQPAFLVERYLPASAAAALPMSVAAVETLCAEDRAAGDSVRYVQSIYLPTEDTCFCLFRAASSDAVRAINAEGNFPFDRMTRAVLLLTRPNPPFATDGETTS